MLLEKPTLQEIFVEPTEQPPFSHPMEAEFARILDYYGIEWQYEPRTFVLGRDAEGTITEAFSPDFYLPSEDLYVELTTMRPALVAPRPPCRRPRRQHTADRTHSLPFSQSRNS